MKGFTNSGIIRIPASRFLKTLKHENYQKLYYRIVLKRNEYSIIRMSDIWYIIYHRNNEKTPFLNISSFLDSFKEFKNSYRPQNLIEKLFLNENTKTIIFIILESKITF